MCFVNCEICCFAVFLYLETSGFLSLCVKYKASLEVYGKASLYSSNENS